MIYKYIHILLDGLTRRYIYIYIYIYIYVDLFCSQIPFVCRSISHFIFLFLEVLVFLLMLLRGACLSLFVFGVRFSRACILVCGSFATGPSFADCFRRCKI